MSMLPRAVLTALLVVSAGALTVPGLADAAPAAAGRAEIRSAHLSPDTPGVDVYLTAFSGGTTTLWVPDEVYGGLSKYTSIKAGIYTVSMRPHGAPKSQAPTLTWTLQAGAGRAYTAAAVGTGSARRGVVLDDDLTPPAPGKARVRLIQAASVAPKATVVAIDGPVVAAGASFATATGYAQVPAGTWPLQARSDSRPVLTATSSVSVPAGSVTSLLLLDKPSGGLVLRAVLDAAGAATMPVGAVPAGGGGTATGSTGAWSGNGNGLPLILSGTGLLALMLMIRAYGRGRITAGHARKA